MAAIDRTEGFGLPSALVRKPSVDPRMDGGAGEGESAGVLAERLRALESEFRRAR